MSGEEGLESRFATPKSKDADAFGIQVHLGTNQPVRPVTRCEEAMSEQGDVRGLIAASNEDQRATRACLKVDLVVGG